MEIPVEPLIEAVVLYLRANGWEVERQDARRSIWIHATGARVFVPARPAVDSPDLLRTAVQEIARAEGQGEDELMIDLVWRQFDKLHVRRDAPQSALLLNDALDLHGALYDAVVAAARASSEPRASYLGRWPHMVESYIDRVLLIPSVPGSFVVRALLPLDEPPDQERLPLVGPAAPKVRAIATTLLRAAAGTVETAREVAQGAPVSRWNEAVPLGVSSNLCDALSRLTGLAEDRTGGDVELRITWTWSAPNESTPAVIIPRGLAPVIAAGGDFLHGEPEEHTIRIVGLVTKLHREEASGPGEVTVRGHIENWEAGSRAIRFELDEPTYRVAISGHEAGQSVRTRAVVRQSDRGLTVVRVDDFQVLT
jgi:hypothetical protein